MKLLLALEQKQADAPSRQMDAKIEREEQKEEAAWEAWESRSQTLAAQRAEQQRQQAAAAYQAYRQGERAEPPKTPTPTASVTPTASNTPTASRTPTLVKTPQPTNSELDSATRSYMAWAKAVKQEWSSQLGLTIQSHFTIDETSTILKVADRLAQEMGGSKIFRQELGPVQIIKDDTIKAGGLGEKGKVTLKTGFSEWTVAHELAHAWDANHDWKLSAELERATGGYTLSELPYHFNEYCARNDPYNELPGCNKALYFYGNVPPKTSDNNFNRLEDFAESVAAYLYPEQAKAVIKDQLARYELKFKRMRRSDLYLLYHLHLYYDDFRSTPRGQYIASLMGR